MKIFPLSEGSFTVDQTKSFVPYKKGSDDLLQRSAGSLLVEIQPFAVLTGDDIIIIDTGLGFFNEEGVLQLHQNLFNHGIRPDQVSKVLLSHLHKDHAGGIAMKDHLSNAGVLSFPNAHYYVSKKEMEYAIEKGMPSYNTVDFDTLRSSGKLVLLEEEAGNIDAFIHYQVTGGHCPFHTVYWIRENNEIIFFGGDVAPQLQQMKSRFVAKYDFDGKKSMELRSKWWKEGCLQHWKFLFYHDIKTPFLQV